MSSIGPKTVLLLGMINSGNEYAFNEPYGQEFRDNVRCTALAALGYFVHSIDDKHADVNGRHCNANFNDFRRMLQSFERKTSFPLRLEADIVILDYFFSPVTYNKLLLLDYYYIYNIILSL